MIQIRLLTLFAVFLIPFLLKGQCTDGSEPECTCESATLLCSINELDGYTFSMDEFFHPEDGPPGFLCPSEGGTAGHNPTWFAFTAWCEELTLTVSVSNCSQNFNFCSPIPIIGAQIAIYEDCDSYTPVNGGCAVAGSDCNEDDKTLDMDGLIIGNTYYFLIDGCCGSACDVVVDITGVCGNEEFGPEWDGGAQPSGEQFTCLNNEYTYTMPALTAANTYHWFYDGNEIETDDPSIDITWDEVGIHQLCVDASNDPCLPINEPPFLSCFTIVTLDPDAGSLTANPEFQFPDEISTITVSGYNTFTTGLSHMLFVVDPTGVIVEISDQDMVDVTYDDCGVMTVYSLSYISAEGAVGASTLPNLGDSWSDPGCGDLFCCDLKSIDITFTKPGTPINDLCTTPQSHGELMICEPVTVYGDNSNASPDFNLSNCNIGTEPTVWHSFTVPTGATSLDITNVTGGVNLTFTDNACPPTSVVLDCISGDTSSMGFMAGSTYFVAVTTPFGSESAYSFDLLFNTIIGASCDDGNQNTVNDVITSNCQCLGVLNDECVQDSVCNNNLFILQLSTTTMADTLCLCNVAESNVGICGDNTIWFELKTDEDVNSILLNLNNNVNESFISIYPSNCNLNPIYSCQLMPFSFDVMPDTTYIVSVSGIPDCESEESVIGIVVRECNNGNDLCNSPQVEGELLLCTPVTVSGDNAGACPDFNLSNCNAGSESTVWHTFTVPVGAAIVDIANITGGVNLTFIDNVCPPTILFEDCISTDVTSTNLLGGMTYNVAVTTPVGLETVYSFDLIASFPLVNDFCQNAIDGSGSGTTCCAGDDGVGNCGFANTVWHSYVSTTSFAQVDVSSSGGTLGVDVFTGDCSALTAVDLGNYCGDPGGFMTIDVACVDPGTSIFVQISNVDEASCGDYNITFTEPEACTVGLDCGAGNATNPSTNGGPACLSACNDFVCGMDGCGENVIWFEFTTDDVATNAVITVNGADFNPAISVFPIACDEAPVASCSPSPFAIPVNSNTTYFVSVSNVDGPTGDFELCIQTFLAFAECGNADELMITRPDYPDLPAEGPYCPGEKVNICYSVNYTIDSTTDPDGSNCQWIQGIVPSIGGGWDLEDCPIEDQGPSGWNWLPEGSVDYNINESIYQLTTNCDGALELTLGGGLGAGDLLPAGWWYVSPGGSPGCIASGDPDDMRGLPGACGSTYTVAFCFDLRVREIEDLDQCADPCFTDLKVNIFTFADGQTGCWSVNSCAADEPAIFDAVIDCSAIVTVEGTGDEICSGGTAELTVTAEDGISTIIVEAVDNPNVEGETSGELSFGGSGFFLEGPLVNTGTDTEIVIYEAYVPNPDSDFGCHGPTLDIEVIVYPEPTYTVDTAYCSIDLKMFTAIISTTGTLSSVSSGTFTNNGNGSWTISNITSGSDLTGIIINEQGCNTQVVISTPSLCSDVCNIDHVVSNIACDDSGTPSDPSDDTYSFNIEVTGSNTDVNWSANDPNGETGSYGTSISFGPYAISGGNLSFVITDDGDSSCSTDVSIVAPSTCSEVCDIEYIVSNIECNDNGTPSDPSDDTYSFDIEVNGNNVGSTWISSDPNVTSGSYGSVVSFGPYSIINEGDLSFTTTDGLDSACFTQINIIAPSTCSITSINELDLENNLEVISLFPNPTHQSLSVVCNDQFSKKLDFFLYDQFGKIVLNIELVKEQTNLNVEGLTSGIYFFTVKDNESQVHQGKLIKL